MLFLGPIFRWFYRISDFWLTMVCMFIAVPIFVSTLQDLCDDIWQYSINAGFPAESCPPKGIPMPFLGLPDQPLTEYFELYKDPQWGLNPTTRDKTFLATFNMTMCVNNARWLQQFIGVGQPGYASYVRARIWDDIMGNYWAVFCQAVGCAFTMKRVFGSKENSIGYNIVMFTCVIGFIGDSIENNSLNYALLMQPEDDTVYRIACFGVVFKIWFTVMVPCILEYVFLMPVLYFSGIRWVICTLLCCRCRRQKEAGEEAKEKAN